MPVDLIETAVERAYGDVRLPGDQVERVREKLGKALAGMRGQAEDEATRQRQRLAKLGEAREKLLHAYYAGAVPVDLLRSEQDRLSTETSQAERHLEVAEASVTDVEDTLGKALDLLANCQRAYLAAPGICAASGIKRCSSGWSSMTTGWGKPRSPSRSPPWPIPSCQQRSMARLSPAAALLLAAVRVRGFQWS